MGLDIVSLTYAPHSGRELDLQVIDHLCAWFRIRYFRFRWVFACNYCMRTAVYLRQMLWEKIVSSLPVARQHPIG